MKHILLFLLCIGIGLISSCKSSTDTDEYDSLWSPFAGTKWVKPGNAESFVATNGGFSFIAAIADTGTYNYTFIPSMYIVSNITSARDGFLTFRAMIIDIPDTVKLSAGGFQLHTFGVLRGTVQTKGADSIITSPKPFAANGTSTIPLSVKPDSSSREIRFNVNVAWNPFSGGATPDTLKRKKIAIEFFDVKMRVNGIDVLSE